MIVVCPNCGLKSEAPEKARGMMLPCPKCKTGIYIEQIDDAPFGYEPTTPPQPASEPLALPGDIDPFGVGTSLEQPLESTERGYDLALEIEPPPPPGIDQVLDDPDIEIDLYDEEEEFVIQANISAARTGDPPPKSWFEFQYEPSTRFSFANLKMVLEISRSLLVIFLVLTWIVSTHLSSRNLASEWEFYKDKDDQERYERELRLWKADLSEYPDTPDLKRRLKSFSWVTYFVGIGLFGIIYGLILFIIYMLVMAFIELIWVFVAIEDHAKAIRGMT